MQTNIVDFSCNHCGIDTLRNGEYYMLKTSIWLKANNGKTEGMRCLNCVEVTLGRQLTAEDFSTALVNFLFPMSIKMFSILQLVHEQTYEDRKDSEFYEEAIQEHNERLKMLETASTPELIN